MQGIGNISDRKVGGYSTKLLRTYDIAISGIFRYMYSLIDTRAVKLYLPRLNINFEFLITWVAWHLLLCQPRDSLCLLTLLHGDLVLYRRRHRLALFHRLVFTDLKEG